SFGLRASLHHFVIEPFESGQQCAADKTARGRVEYLVAQLCSSNQRTCGTFNSNTRTCKKRLYTVAAIFVEFCSMVDTLDGGKHSEPADASKQCIKGGVLGVNH